jgi:hypothetical protein
MEQEAAYLRFGVKALMSSLSRIHETIDLLYRRRCNVPVWDAC